MYLSSAQYGQQLAWDSELLLEAAIDDRALALGAETL